MASGTKSMRAIKDLLAEKRQERDRLDIEIGALEQALQAAAGEPTAKQTLKRAPRSNVKGVVLRLLEQVGDTGLNAAIAVDLAKRQNTPIERGTVSSLLSRLKAEGTVIHDGTVYRLKDASRTQPVGNARDVLDFPASKAAP